MAVYRPNGFIEEVPQSTKSTDVTPSPIESALPINPSTSNEVQERKRQLTQGCAVRGDGGLITAQCTPTMPNGASVSKVTYQDSLILELIEKGELERSTEENYDPLFLEHFILQSPEKSVFQQSHHENLDQPQVQPIKRMSPVVRRPTTYTTCFLSDGSRDSLLLAPPEKGSPQPSHNETSDQPRLAPTLRMASIDIGQASSATSNCCPSPELASSSESSLCPDSDESSNFLEDNGGHLVVLLVKHMLLVDLMQEFYAIFDQRWAAKVQGHVGSSPPTTPPTNQNRKSDSSHKGKKRCRDDRDFTPPNDGGSRKRPSNDIPSNTEKQNDPFACPFHKHEPAKYCCSVIDGSRYRACVGPGFATIARLK